MCSRVIILPLFLCMKFGILLLFLWNESYNVSTFLNGSLLHYGFFVNETCIVFCHCFSVAILWFLASTFTIVCTKLEVIPVIFYHIGIYIFKHVSLNTTADWLFSLNPWIQYCFVMLKGFPEGEIPIYTYDIPIIWGSIYMFGNWGNANALA